MHTPTPRSTCKFRGFTLVELMIALAVLGVLLALALPSFTDMLRNGKVRAAAETVLFGIQLARSEAVKRNGSVGFAFVDSDPTTIAATAPAFSSVTAGGNWVVYADDGTTRELIDSRSSVEGARSGTTTVDIATNLPGVPGASATRLIFDSLGRPTELNNLGRIDFTAPGAVCQYAGGTVRCLRVVVSPAGSVRLCDPVAAGAADPRVCPVP